MARNFSINLYFHMWNRNIAYVSVKRWRRSFEMLWMKMSRALKDALENLDTRKAHQFWTKGNNLRSKVFSARSSQSIINAINLSKTNDCECNSSSIISIGNQKALEIIRIWTKHAWNYSLISLVTIWLQVLTCENFESL